jgi:hypothetical protein
VTTKESVHYLKTMGKCPYDRQEEDVLGSGHRQQQATHLWMQGGVSEIRLYLIKEKQALRYHQFVKQDNTLVFHHSSVSDTLIFSLNDVLAL